MAILQQKKSLQAQNQIYRLQQINTLAQFAEDVEYTNCTADEEDLPNECLGYDAKQSDGEASILKLWGI